MKVFINDKEHSFDVNELEVSALLKELGIKPDGLVIELDNNVLTFNDFNTNLVKDGSRLELIRIFGGG